MSWLFSRALVEEYSEGTCSDGEPCAQWNVMPTPQGFWRNDKMMAFSRLSLFGPTLKLLTEQDGEELLTLFLAAFPVRTLVQPEKVKALPESDRGSGKSSPGLLAKFDPDTCSLKTVQCSLFEDSIPSSLTLPKCGSMRNGSVYQRPNVELCISATEFGYSVPTPTAAAEAPNKKANTKGPKNLMDVATGEWQHLLPTPTTNEGNRNKSNGPGAKVRPSLGMMAKKNLWPTPKANDANKGGNFDLDNPRNGLAAAAKKWPTPTPTASDFRGAPTLEAVQRRAKESSRGVSLGEELRRNGTSGQLNPTWVEWLMGWTLGWTDLKPLEMDRFQEWQQQHSSCCDQELKNEEPKK